MSETEKRDKDFDKIFESEHYSWGKFKDKINGSMDKFVNSSVPVLNGVIRQKSFP